MNILLCPKCKNTESTTSFVGYDIDNDNNVLEQRECDDPNCRCKYEVKYIPTEIKVANLQCNM